MVADRSRLGRRMEALAHISHRAQPAHQPTLSDWNIIASRWFTGVAGGGVNADNDYHFAIKSPTTGGAIHRLNLYTTSSNDLYGVTDFALNKWYLVGFTLSASGNLQLYVNGQPDGLVQTGVTHTARTTNYLWVGDLRTQAACFACTLNGNIGKFRLWNSVLTSSQVAADYRNEASVFGYQSNLALSLSTPAPIYRTNNTITATISGPPSPAGKITFYDNGKLIVGCKNKVVSTTTPSCAWKPSRHGRTTLTASYAPNDASYLSGSATGAYIVDIRAARR
jgi:Concanavalin A-like lectin/glucanases superfamily